MLISSREVLRKGLGIIPIERWVRTIGNVLKWLSLAFILLFILALLLILRDCGFTAEQRINLIIWIFILMGVVLLFGIILALLPGGLLYSPYEQSLRRGKRYGTEKTPISKRKSAELPVEHPISKLPPKNQDIKRLP
jgi:hypothetical protein